MSISPVPTGTDEKKYHSSGRTWRQASRSLVCVATVYGPSRRAAATGSSIMRSVLPVSKLTFSASLSDSLENLLDLGRGVVDVVLQSEDDAVVRGDLDALLAAS